MRSDHKYSDHFKTCREQLGLTQHALADALLLSRNYIAQIETGKREPSVRVLSALEALVDKKLTEPTAAKAPPGPEDYVVTGSYIPPHAEEQAPYAVAVDIEKELRQKFDRLLQAAEGDVGRLGWIREQFRQHLSEPVHWGMHARIEREVLAQGEKIIAREKAEAEKKRRSQHRSA